MSPFRQSAAHEPEPELVVPDFRSPPKLRLEQRLWRWSFTVVSVAWVGWTLFGIVTGGAIGWLLFVVAATLGIFAAFRGAQRLMALCGDWQSHRVARRVAELMTAADR